MEKQKHLHRQLVHGLLSLILIVGIAGSAFAANPVTVTMTITGETTPGATVTAKANVTITDGSTLQSIKWSQVGGVHATLANTTTDTVTITLPNRRAFREELMLVLEEPPLPDAQLPANVPANPAYEGGLQNRFGVVGFSPHARIDAAAVKLDIEVTTSSGTYHNAAAVAGRIPWETAIGTRNVPTLLPVLLHGKTQAS